MAEKFVSERNLQFLLYEVFDTDRLVHDPYYAEHSPENFRMAIQTALKIGEHILKPKFREMDQQTPVFVDGRVKVNPAVRAFMQELGHGGWMGATFPFEAGGQQFPLIVWAACRFIFAACSYSGSVYEMLTTGAANLIVSFGSPFLRENYLPPMLSGQWQGTMALTESQAGSSLTDITTEAEPVQEGYYRIRGQKTFISAGDHDGVENIVHLLLAKIKGAPAGAKGFRYLLFPKCGSRTDSLFPMT
jgi:alkylation response protein AidB-like acyl-CoA dehydrogenase